MALTPHQQVTELIQRSQKHILVVTREHASTDGLSALVAMGLLLKTWGKKFDLVAPGKGVTQTPSFLSKDVSISSDVGATRTFHIRLNTQEVPLGELFYDVKDNILDITLVPTHHTWTAKDVTTHYGEDRYDLIIALDCPDLGSLGTLGRDHADLFYRTTIVNIDCHATNEYWGQTNLVDLNAVSNTEVLYHWIHGQTIEMTESLASALLAGMIAETKSFRTPNVTPQTLITCSELIHAGARRDEIVQHLWRTRSVSTLKLWGRALTHLHEDHEIGLIWTQLSMADFLEAGLPAEHLEGIVEELLAYCPEAKTVALIWQHKDGLHLTIHASPPYSAADLARTFGGVGTRERATCQFLETHDLIEGTTVIVQRLSAAIRCLKT